MFSNVGSIPTNLTNEKENGFVFLQTGDIIMPFEGVCVLRAPPDSLTGFDLNIFLLNR